MFEGKSLKFKIVVSMVLLSLITSLITSFVGIIKSSQIISDATKNTFILNADATAEKVYSSLIQVENNTKLMSELIAKSTSIQSQGDMNKLRISQEAEYARIRIYPKTLAENTSWSTAGFFYFDQRYAPSYDGAWFLKEDGVFKRMIVNTPMGEDEDFAWYNDPINQKKPIWSEPYVDGDIGVSMITYSMPVYKNGFLLGVAGMDVALDDLNKILDDVKIYKNTEVFLLDDQFRFVATKKYEVGESALNAANGAYKILENEKNTDGFVKFKDGLTTKVLSYSKMPNGFILVIEVPIKNIPSKMTGTILILLMLGLATVFVAGVLALNLGAFLAKPINDVVFSLSTYARNLSTGADTYLSLSHKLAEGSSQQAASVQETSTTLEESASMVAQNNANTKQAVILAKNTKDVAIKGGQEMKQMVAAMEELKKSSAAIGKITEVISKIASQTNILALNAAVEAARAGEAGLGFSVVAEEVRNLAQRTATATKDIAQMIEQNIELSDTCEHLTKRANESLSEINMQAQKVSELLNEIATSTNEQATGISQITTAVNQIEQIVQVNATHADTIAHTSEELLGNIQTGINTIERIVNGTIH